MNQKKIYLAGEYGAWRKEAQAHFPDAICMDPYRRKDLSVAYTCNEIVISDKRDIQRCDVVLAEMTNPKHNYIGTSMEIAYAYSLGKPVVMYCPKNIAEHPWIKYHTVKAFDNLLECSEYIRSYW